MGLFKSKKVTHPALRPDELAPARIAPVSLSVAVTEIASNGNPFAYTCFIDSRHFDKLTQAWLDTLTIENCHQFGVAREDLEALRREEQQVLALTGKTDSNSEHLLLWAKHNREWMQQQLRTCLAKTLLSKQIHIELGAGVVAADSPSEMIDTRVIQYLHAVVETVAAQSELATIPVADKLAELNVAVQYNDITKVTTVETTCNKQTASAQLPEDLSSVMNDLNKIHKDDFTRGLIASFSAEIRKQARLLHLPAEASDAARSDASSSIADKEFDKDCFEAALLERAAKVAAMPSLERLDKLRRCMVRFQDEQFPENWTLTLAELDKKIQFVQSNRKVAASLTHLAVLQKWLEQNSKSSNLNDTGIWFIQTKDVPSIIQGMGCISDAIFQCDEVALVAALEKLSPFVENQPRFYSDSWQEYRGTMNGKTSLRTILEDCVSSLQRAQVDRRKGSLSVTQDASIAIPALKNNPDCLVGLVADEITNTPSATIKITAVTVEQIDKDQNVLVQTDSSGLKLSWTALLTALEHHNVLDVIDDSSNNDFFRSYHDTVNQGQLKNIQRTQAKVVYDTLRDFYVSLLSMRCRFFAKKTNKIIANLCQKANLVCASLLTHDAASVLKTVAELKGTTLDKHASWFGKKRRAKIDKAFETVSEEISGLVKSEINGLKASDESPVKTINPESWVVAPDPKKRTKSSFWKPATTDVTRQAPSINSHPADYRAAACLRSAF